MSALTELRGLIRDTDSHEHTPTPHWGSAFGPLMEGFAGFFEEHHDPQGINTFTATVGQDDIAISSETVDSGWRQGAYAPGAIDMHRRLEVLDVLGYRDQMVLSTAPGFLGQLLVSSPPEWIAAGFGIDLRATLGAMDDESVGELCQTIGHQLLDVWNDWCLETAKISPRLRPVAFIDTQDIEETIREVKRLAAGGIRAFNVASGTPPGGMSPGHPDVDPLWDALVANDVALVLHGGGDFGMLRSSVWPEYTARNLVGCYKNPEANFDPYSIAQFHLGVQNFVTIMIYGGVFERFPTLRVGCLETGASWVGPTAENMELVGHQFRTMTKGLSLTPAEYMQRNLRVTPFFWEPVDRYIERFGLEDVYIYGSDYPHFEGGADPAAQHAARLERLGPAVVEKFFVTNAELIMP